MLPAASSSSTAVRCSFSPGSSARRNPCTSSAAASFSVTFFTMSGSAPPPGRSDLRVSFSVSSTRSTVSRGAGTKLRLVIFRFSVSFSSTSAATRSPAALSATTPRKARLGRIGQSRVMLSSLFIWTSWMNFPEVCLTSMRCLPEQMPSRSLGVMPMASPSRKILPPGGSERSWREASDSSILTGSAS